MYYIAVCLLNVGRQVFDGAHRNGTAGTTEEWICGNVKQDVKGYLMTDGDFIFGVGLKSNKETNDFLRCLWSRLAATFGKLAWQYSPYRIGNTIIVGIACIGDNTYLKIRLTYKQRGCVASIDFAPDGTFNHDTLYSQLKKCVKEALNPDKYIRSVLYKGKLDKSISFQKKSRKNFVIEGDSLTLKVLGYDEEDCATMFKAQLLQVCNFLTFDTLRYITLSNTHTGEIRQKHNFIMSLIDSQTGEVVVEKEKNKMYQNLVVSERMADYIDSYLERPYGYEEHYTNFDKSVQLFAQGVRNEELSGMVTGLPEPYAEQAIVAYMSALEIITLGDKEPETCKCCGQMRYSIARRVTDLANAAIKGWGEFVKGYYGDRSKYVHTGMLLSSNSYNGRSVPLMSKSSKTGMIVQVGRVGDSLRDMVKYCIEWHENNTNAI